MDINISLNQGKQFKKLQSKIKTNTSIKEAYTNKTIKKEGFSNNINTINNTNNITEIQTLQKQFESLLSQYSIAEKTVLTENTNLIDRTNKEKNKFLNKNIQTTDGSKGYVTSLGEVKWYGTDDIYNATAGKNGCPNSKNTIPINFAQTAEYQKKDSTIPVDPNLLVGSYMLSGQSCGNEGQNVYVSKMVNSKDVSKIGCYSNINGDALTKTTLTNSTFEKCKQYAIDNAYKIFGLGEYNSTSGTANCYVGNDQTKATQYGNASVVASPIILWSSNTSGKGITIMSISSQGSIQLLTQNGTVIYETTKDTNCVDKKVCNYFLTLQADGNMCMYKGLSPQTYRGGGAIWCSMTNGKQKEANSSWKSSNGKFGKSYLTNGQTLLLGEWIGSEDGKLKLMLQEDGNLVLQTSTNAPGCSINANDKQEYGNQNVLSLYQLSNAGILDNLGKLGYINGNADLREYPSSMIDKGDTYNIQFGTNLSGVTPIATNNASNETECQNQCTSNIDCNMYTYQLGSNVCYQYNNNLNDANMIKVPTDGITLGIRKPKLLNDASCGLDYTEIDTNQWQNYNKGDVMTPTTKCGAAIIAEENKKKLDDIKSQIIDVATNLIDKINNLASTSNQTNQQINIDQLRLKDKLTTYQNIKDKLLKLNQETNNQQLSSTKEQLSSTKEQLSSTKESFLTMGDLQGMLNDSKINVLSYNYNYILWTIFAVGLGLITLKHINK